METTKYVTVELTPETFRALVDLASMVGLSPKSYASLLVVRAINDVAKENKESPEIRMFRLAQVSSRSREQRRILLGIAKHLKSEPDEAYAEEFIQICELLGVDSREIMMQAETDSGGVGSIDIPSNPGISMACDFLINNMETDRDYPAKNMIEVAKAQGIKEHWLKEARRILMIVSTRKSSGWFWRLPSPLAIEQKEAENAKQSA